MGGEGGGTFTELHGTALHFPEPSGRLPGNSPRPPSSATGEDHTCMFQPAQVSTRDDKTFDTGGVEVTTRRRGKRWLIAVVALLAIVVFLAGTKAFQIVTMVKAGKKMVPPPVAVTTAKVDQVEWQPLRPAVGTLDRPARDDAQRRADRHRPRDRLRERLAGEEGPADRPARHLRRTGPAAECAGRLGPGQADARAQREPPSPGGQHPGRPGGCPGAGQADPGDRGESTSHHQQEDHPRPVRRSRSASVRWSSARWSRRGRRSSRSRR